MSVGREMKLADAAKYYADFVAVNQKDHTAEQLEQLNEARAIILHFFQLHPTGEFKEAGEDFGKEVSANLAAIFLIALVHQQHDLVEAVIQARPAIVNEDFHPLGFSETPLEVAILNKDATAVGILANCQQLQVDSSKILNLLFKTYKNARHENEQMLIKQATQILFPRLNINAANLDSQASYLVAGRILETRKLIRDTNKISETGNAVKNISNPHKAPPVNTNELLEINKFLKDCAMLPIPPVSKAASNEQISPGDASSPSPLSSSYNRLRPIPVSPQSSSSSQSSDMELGASNLAHRLLRQKFVSLRSQRQLNKQKDFEAAENKQMSSPSSSAEQPKSGKLQRVPPAPPKADAVPRPAPLSLSQSSSSADRVSFYNATPSSDPHSLFARSPTSSNLSPQGSDSSTPGPTPPPSSPPVLAPSRSNSLPSYNSLFPLAKSPQSSPEEPDSKISEEEQENKHSTPKNKQP